MPWFPEFTSAVELVRLQTREAGHADPVGHYVAALNKKDATDLETAWPGQVVIYDPRAGEVRGHRQVRHFVRQNELWLAGMNPRAETVASTMADGKAVVELVVHLTQDGRDVSWPLAVVAESHDDRSVVFRTYCSQWPLIGRHEVRPPILPPGAGRAPGGIVGQFQDALEAGDADAVVRAFEPDGYFREPIGPQYTHRGPQELHAYFSECFSAGGRCGHAAVRGDRRRRALRGGVQLRPLGPARPAAPGRDRRHRARAGRVAGRGAFLRRRGGSGRAALSSCRV